MCGVFGFVGERLDVGATVGMALKRLEYRGYDSWGMAWEEDRELRTLKEVGRINGTVPVCSYSRIGIGHTRWATHGRVTSANAHPHLDCTGRIAVVHNGIIENIEDLRATLRSDHAMASETDSEVVAHLIEERVAAGDSLEEAVRAIFPRLEGFNAIVAIEARAGKLVAAKRTSPLLVGRADGAAFIASDALAFAGLVTDAAVVDDDTIVCIDHAGIRVRDAVSGADRRPDMSSLACVGNVADESGDEPGLFMCQEIDEQPAVIDQIAANPAPVAGLSEMIRRASSVMIVGCGSALNAAEYGRYLLADHAIHAAVIPASEVHHFAPMIDRGTLVLAVSQSGETADVIDAVHLAQQHGASTAALVNVVHSTLARTADHIVPLLAGTERSVLATKSFTAMLARFVQLAASMAGDPNAARDSLHVCAVAMRDVLGGSVLHEIDRLGAGIARHEHVFILGRGQTWPIAREAALKIQEGAYIHAQAFPSGELKHGPLALITDGTPCIVFAGSGQGAKQLRSNAQEVRSRGGALLGIAAEPDDVFDRMLLTGTVGPAAGIVETVIAQRLAYRAALVRGINPDRPRNLAKSVTVK